MSPNTDSVVAVGVSGGVDSSVAALMLKRNGFRVVGVSHRVRESSANPHVQAERRAEAVCRELGIPFFSIDLSDEFRSRIINDFAIRYREGLTPNPCVLCNEQIKFGIFPPAVRTRLEGEGLLSEGQSLYFATGHYVRTVVKNGRTYLRKATDRRKDQSYMLYRLEPEILSRCIFPLGTYEKSEIVEIAAEEGLPTAGVGESQDICFIEGDYADYIEKYLGEEGEPGPIVDTLGRSLGKHRGYMHYTIGQRQGLGLSDGPWYVEEVDAARNTVTVARKEELGRSSLSAGGVVLTHPLPDAFEAEVRVRYNSPAVACRVVQKEEKNEISVELSEPTVITPGQSAVLYDGDIVLGGGFILPESGKPS